MEYSYSSHDGDTHTYTQTLTKTTPLILRQVCTSEPLCVFFFEQDHSLIAGCVFSWCCTNEECDCNHAMRDDLSEMLKRSERSFLVLLKERRQRHSDKQFNKTLYIRLLYILTSPVCVQPKYTVCESTIKSLFFTYNQQPNSSVYDYCLLSTASLQQRTNI